MRKYRRLVLALAVAALVLWMLLPAAGPSIEPGSILVLDLDGSYIEAAEPAFLVRVLGEDRRPFASLLSELGKAERDDRLAAVVLRIRNLQIGWAQAQEIRDAIADLSAAGRRTVGYLEVTSLGANLEYYVATAADEIHAAPSATTALVGLAAEFLFLGEMWEKLGAGIEAEGSGEYKSAAETLTRREMSPAHREMANALLDSTNAQFIAGIARGRGISEEFVRTAIDSAPMSPREMLALGLIDGISFQDEIASALGGGPVVLGEDYARVDPADVGFAPVAEFALVYGSGSVVTGRGSSSPAGGVQLASDTVSAALEQAAKDDGIDAIIFRVDSPGGSPLAADIVWRATQRARGHGKPLIASFSDVAASAGYYVACGADAIVTPPGSLVGSIGVVFLRPVLGGLLDKLGIGVESLTRGANADLLLLSKPLSESSRGRLRDEISALYDVFVRRVADGRGLSRERVDELGRGRVWTGAEAAENGLVDALGGLRAAVRLAKDALQIDPDADVALVPYPAPKSLLEQMDEVLRRVAVMAAPGVPLPRLVREIEPWLATVPDGGPALLPPFLIDIR